MKTQKRLSGLLTLALSAALATGVRAQDGTFQELDAPPRDFDILGWDVDIAGDLIVVGAPNWSAGEFSPFGAALLYQRDNGGTPNNPSDDTFLPLAILRVAPGGLSSQGESVATDGMSVFVGGGTSRIYEEMGGVWAPVVELPFFVPDAAMRGGTLVFKNNTTGSVDVWERSGNSWSQTQVIQPSGNLIPISVDFDGNRIAVTARNTAADRFIITFTKPDNVWVEEQMIVPSIPGFGARDVSLDADVMVYLPSGSGSSSPEVLVFQHDPALGWVETQVLTASDNGSVSAAEVDGDRMYLGTRSSSGLRGVDIYERGATQWELREVIPELLPEENVTAIAAANGTVVVGQERLSPMLGGVSVFRVPFYATTTDSADVPITLTDGVTGEQPVEITFSNISTSGTTSLTTTQQAPSVPTGFSLSDQVIFYEIETTANFSGTVTICIDYSNVNYVDESDLRLLHYENGAWQDVTFGTVDTVNNIICGQTTSLSPFAIVDATAAPDPLLMMLDLVDAVTALNLAHGIDNSLDAKLDNALDTFGDVIEQNDDAAINSLGAFISAVNAQSGNQIPTTDAETLIDFAEDIIAVLHVQM